MLVNCFFAFKWLVHSMGCSCLSCTNKTVGYCLVGALQGGAVVPTAPTKLLATARLVHCKGVQLSQLHQQSCWATTWLVHCKGVHQQNCWLLLGWCT